MDWNRVEGDWKQLKGKVKTQWGKLTDDDLDRIAGSRDELRASARRYSFLTATAPRSFLSSATM